MELYSWVSIEELIYTDIIHFGLCWVGRVFSYKRVPFPIVLWKGKSYLLLDTDLMLEHVCYCLVEYDQCHQ